MPAVSLLSLPLLFSSRYHYFLFLTNSLPSVLLKIYRSDMNSVLFSSHAVYSPPNAPISFPHSTWSTAQSGASPALSPAMFSSNLLAQHESLQVPIGSPMLAMNGACNLLAPAESPDLKSKGRCFLCGTFGHVAK
jgi:hypothetical protein